MNFNQKIALVQSSSLIVGIDIAKKIHIATLMTPLGKELKVGLKVLNSREGFDALGKATPAKFRNNSNGTYGPLL